MATMLLPLISRRRLLAAVAIAFGSVASGVAASGEAASRPTEYEVLKAFPPGRLAALHAGDWPDKQGLTGGNRSLGKWLEAREFAGAFDLQRRAEEVPVHEYVALAQALQ